MVALLRVRLTQSSDITFKFDIEVVLSYKYWVTVPLVGEQIVVVQVATPLVQLHSLQPSGCKNSAPLAYVTPSTVQVTVGINKIIIMLSFSIHLSFLLKLYHDGRIHFSANTFDYNCWMLPLLKYVCAVIRHVCAKAHVWYCVCMNSANAKILRWTRVHVSVRLP